MSQGVGSKHLFAIFIPAIALGALIFAIGIAQYQPLYPTAPAAPANPTTLQSIPLLPGDPILGNKKAKHTIIIFGDFGCESCHAQMALLEQLLQSSGNTIKIFWKGLPATRIPYPSDTAHLYAYCANQQGKFLPFADAVFASIDNLLPTGLNQVATKINLNETDLAACTASAAAKQHLADTEAIATELHIQAVPTIFLDNIQIQPPSSIDDWQSLVS